MADEIVKDVASVKFGEEYVTKEFQRGVSIDWRKYMKRKFQAKVERKGYVLASSVKMWLAPWDEVDDADNPYRLAGADRFRLAAMFVPAEEER